MAAVEPAVGVGAIGTAVGVGGGVVAGVAVVEKLAVGRHLPVKAILSKFVPPLGRDSWL